jgi:hypothetical protein
MRRPVMVLSTVALIALTASGWVAAPAPANNEDIKLQLRTQVQPFHRARQNRYYHH